VAAGSWYGEVSVADALRERLALLAPQGEPATDLATTPRLEGYGAQLDEGFGLDALCEAIADDRHHALHELVGLDLGEAMRIQAADGSTLGLTLDSQLTPTERGTRHRGAVGLALEVVGRWHRSRVVDLPLYQGATCTDLRLSRRHLGWLGSGVVRVARGGRLLRQLTASTYDRGEVALQHLDLVQLTAATWVRVVAPDRAG